MASSVKEVGRLWLDWFLNWLFGVFLIGFSLMYPIGTWKLDPFWIIIFARVFTPGFTNVHFTSIAIISIVTAYLIVRDRKTIQPFQWIAVVFAGAALHDWMVYVWDVLIFHATVPAYWKNMVWFAFLIGSGVLFGNRKQRMVLGLLAAYLFVMMGVYVAAFNNSDAEIGVYTVQTVADNFMEVLGWVTTAIAFLF